MPPQAKLYRLRPCIRSAGMIAACTPIGPGYKAACDRTAAPCPATPELREWNGAAWSDLTESQVRPQLPFVSYRFAALAMMAVNCFHSWASLMPPFSNRSNQALSWPNCCTRARAASGVSGPS